MTPDQIAAELQRLQFAHYVKQHIVVDECAPMPDAHVLELLLQRKAQLDPIALYDRQFLKDLGIQPL